MSMDARVPEQEPLRVHRPRRVHVEPDAARVPALQGLLRIGIDVSLELPVAIALLPEQPLEDLQRRDLRIGIDPRDELRRGLVDGRLPAQLLVDGLELQRDLGLVRVGAHPVGDLRARMGEEHVLHEGERGGGALDVGQDRPDHARLAT